MNRVKNVYQAYKLQLETHPIRTNVATGDVNFNYEGF